MKDGVAHNSELTSKETKDPAWVGLVSQWGPGPPLYPTQRLVRKGQALQAPFPNLGAISEVSSK